MLPEMTLRASAVVPPIMTVAGKVSIPRLVADGHGAGDIRADEVAANASRCSLVDRYRCRAPSLPEIRLQSPVQEPPGVVPFGPPMPVAGAPVVDAVKGVVGDRGGARDVGADEVAAHQGAGGVGRRAARWRWS